MDEYRLDRNAVGGIMGEVFAFEMTTAETACARCGSTYRIGALMVYAHDMETIVRCVACDNAMIRVARGLGRYWVDLRGVKYLQIEET
jgi:Family of unknown function (DUF6510)